MSKLVREATKKLLRGGGGSRTNKKKYLFLKLEIKFEKNVTTEFEGSGYGHSCRTTKNFLRLPLLVYNGRLIYY